MAARRRDSETGDAVGENSGVERSSLEDHGWLRDPEPDMETRQPPTVKVAHARHPRVLRARGPRRRRDD